MKTSLFQFVQMHYMSRSLASVSTSKCKFVPSLIISRRFKSQVHSIKRITVVLLRAASGQTCVGLKPQRECGSKPLKHSLVERILVFKR